MVGDAAKGGFARLNCTRREFVSDKYAQAINLRHTAKEAEGIVRLTGRELTVRKWSRISCSELTPFGKGGRSVEFEVLAAAKMAFLVKMVVDRSVDRGKFL